MHTLILAFDDQGTHTTQDIYILVALSKDPDPVPALMAAFEEWAKTTVGKKAIWANGWGWIGALGIPRQILQKHGILEFYMVPSANSFYLPAIKWNRKMIVNWDMRLLSWDTTVMIREWHTKKGRRKK